MMQSDEKLNELMDKLEPLIMDLAQYYLPNEVLRIAYPVGSVTFEFKNYKDNENNN